MSLAADTARMTWMNMQQKFYSAFILTFVEVDTGVLGRVLKDACRVQNAFLGRNKRRKTALQKQTASMTCPSVSHQELLATMPTLVVGLCQAYHSPQIRTCA
ncbi:uncharacterized protein GJ701_005324 isoform 1-T1 [Geothlypis trichas]